MLEIKQIKINSSQNTKEFVKGKVMLNPWVKKALDAKASLELENAVDHNLEKTPQENIETKVEKKEKRHLQMRMNVSINMVQKLKM